MSAWQTYDLYSQPNGTITGVTETNDDNDDGFPDPTIETWDVSYKSHEEMMRRTGGTHVGCSGIAVTVYLDGAEVSK